MRRDKDNSILAEQSSDGYRDEKTISFIDLIDFVWPHKLLIIVFAAIGFLIAAFYASTLKPVYQTSALLQVNQQNQSFIPSYDINSRTIGANLISTEMRLITSHPVLTRVVNNIRQGYIVTPRYYPLIGSTIARLYSDEGLADPMFGLAEYAWGGEILKLDSFQVTGELEHSSMVWKLTVGQGQEYSLWSENGDLVLSGKAGKIATGDYRNSVIEINVSRLLSRPHASFTLRQMPAVSSIGSLEAALTVHSDRDVATISPYDTNALITLSMKGQDPEIITTTVNAVANTYVEQSLADQSKKVQQQLGFIDGQIPLLKAKLDTAQRTLQEFQQNRETVDLDFETRNALTQLNDYTKEISELQFKKEDLKRRFTENHPEVIVASRKIENIQQKHQETKALLHAMPEREWEYIQKARDVSLATDLYVRLLNMAQELRIAKAGVTGTAKLINMAIVNPWPVRPNTSMICFNGLIAGLLLALAWIFFKHLIHNKVTDPLKLEQDTGLHIYAKIPHSAVEQAIFSQVESSKQLNDGKLRLLAYEKDTDLAIEALRSFRTSLRFTMKAATNNVVIITGLSPSSGKSFIASNYAAVAAKEGQRVLLLDADMRRGHLHHNLGKPMMPGLSDLLANEVDLDDVVHEISENLYFISAGERPPNPAELLGSDDSQQLVMQLQTLYDLVIVDTPPILAVTDASIIAQYGGQLFLLLRYDQHHIDEIHEAISLFEKSGVLIAGLLFNDMKMNMHGKNHSYYHYEY